MLPSIELRLKRRLWIEIACLLQMSYSMEVSFIEGASLRTCRYSARSSQQQYVQYLACRESRRNLGPIQ